MALKNLKNPIKKLAEKKAELEREIFELGIKKKSLDVKLAKDKKTKDAIITQIFELVKDCEVVKGGDKMVFTVAESNKKVTVSYSATNKIPIDNVIYAIRDMIKDKDVLDSIIVQVKSEVLVEGALDTLLARKLLSQKDFDLLTVETVPKRLITVK